MIDSMRPGRQMKCVFRVFLISAFVFSAAESPSCTAAQSDQVDLVVTNIVYDLTNNLPLQGSRRLFAVDVRVDTLTGRVINNVYLFRVNLFWARGPAISDRIGLAATGRFQWNHAGHPVGTTKRLMLPSTISFKTLYRQPKNATHLVAEVTEFTGITEIDPTDNIRVQTVLTTATLASRILANSRVTLDTVHAVGPADGATALLNVRNAAAGITPQRSVFSVGHRRGPGGQTELDVRMLNAVNLLAQTYTLRISEIAGGVHPTITERHYKGLAIRVTHINGIRVSSTHPQLVAFTERLKTLGAAAVYSPLNESGRRDNVYAAWPDHSEVSSTTSTPIP